ncbi:MAG: HEAT repeat domain-containing protein [Dokdonella sp.]
MKLSTFNQLVLILTTAACAVIGSVAIASEASLNRAVTANDGWVGYSVPMIAAAGSPCCYNIHNGKPVRRGCSLDGESWSSGSTQDSSDLTPKDDTLKIYLHVVDGKIESARSVAASCPVEDADRARWLDNVAAVDSVAMLARRVRDAGGKSHDDADDVLAALAMHDEPLVTAQLARFVEPSNAHELRQHALFWLGEMRGAAGADIVERYATTDADPKLRAHAVFVLSESSAVDGYAKIHRIAQRDPADHVREQALFWMAQMNDPRARNDIDQAIRSDPSAHVREQGVFALSQLKDGQATAALIDIVRGDYPREVKKQALFWLGESGSSAALAFLDSVLGKDRLADHDD